MLRLVRRRMRRILHRKAFLPLAAPQIALALVLISHARADTSIIIYDSLGYETGSGAGVDGPGSPFGLFASGFSFVPATTLFFDSAQIEIGGFVNTQGLIGTNAFSLRLEAADGPSGLPSTILESFTIVGQLQAFGSVHPAITAQSLVHPVLQSGQKYWLVALGEGDMQGAWNVTAPVARGDYYSIQGGREVLLTDQELGAFRITGVTQVPEPTVVTFLSVFLTLFLVFAKKKNL